MSADRLVWLAGPRWPIKQCFRNGRQFFGLDGYENRSWQSWHRHTTLVMLTHFFVVREMLQLPKTARPDRAPNLSAGGRGPAPVPRPTAPSPSWATAKPTPNATDGTASICSGNMKFRYAIRPDPPAHGPWPGRNPASGGLVYCNVLGLNLDDDSTTW